ncbi:MAG TPA: Erv1/Alr family FAD-linked sulfhydryl oxidase [Candidatus Saccharimonadales bacterium]|nr:Erv1/Alr family FAD-linked sulfhydryl oxidase [Candidatus Saccharimonadales bacterium]
MSNTNNPQYIGPGTWNVIHTLAFHAKTNKQQDAFIKTLKVIIDYFPCDVCKKHSLEYIKNHPLKDFKNDKLGMFIWTWKFHNQVNYRTNKPHMEWNMALHLYSQYANVNEEHCSKSCSESD